MLRSPSLELRVLEKGWPRGELLELKKQIRERIGNDPISLPVDLLSPLRAQFNETLHTQALVYLFDESKPHRLGRVALIDFIESAMKVKSANDAINNNASKILTLARRNSAIVKITPEYRYLVEDNYDKKVARCDILIEIADGQSSEYGLVIVENKINARITDQRSWYQRESQKWRSTHHSVTVLLILLSRNDRLELTSLQAKAWLSFSYLELASMLRRRWVEIRELPIGCWLGLYIVTIMRGVL